MVKAIIDISDEANRIFNIIKAKHGLRDKSQAINLVAEEYAEEVLEPELRPEFVERMLQIKKEKAVKIGSVNELRKLMEIG
ncbi:MAG: antitoxin [Colwelliaceae bacterium]|nr:antitoxin [Colwelliaceae bacterium]|tara:strand:- start:1332 stop:1574 length:243 start_codon:yes stop_codon:yes gene_type:complete